MEYTALTREGSALLVVDETPQGFSANTRLRHYVDMPVCGPRHETLKAEILQKGWSRRADRGRIERSELIVAGGAKFGRHHFAQRETAEDFADFFGVTVREHRAKDGSQ